MLSELFLKTTAEAQQSRHLWPQQQLHINKFSWGRNRDTFSIFDQQKLNYWCKNEKEKAIWYQMRSVQPFDIKLSGDVTEMFSTAVFLQLLFYCSLLRVRTPSGVFYKGHQCQCPLYPIVQSDSKLMVWCQTSGCRMVDITTVQILIKGHLHGPPVTSLQSGLQVIKLTCPYLVHHYLSLSSNLTSSF